MPETTAQAPAGSGGATVPPTPSDAPTGACLMMFVAPTDAERLAVSGYEAPEELHVTIAYLAQPAASYTAEQRVSYEDSLKKLNMKLPTTANADQVEVFNGDNAPTDEHPPCTVLRVDGGGLADLRSGAVGIFGDQIDQTFPDFKPHITLGYGIPADMSVNDRLGTVQLDRLIMAWSDQRVVIAGDQSYGSMGDMAGATDTAVVQVGDHVCWNNPQGEPLTGVVDSVNGDSVSVTPHDGGDSVDVAVNDLTACVADPGSEPGDTQNMALPGWWSATLAPLGYLAGDKRRMIMPPRDGKLRQRMFPMPFSWQRMSADEGHRGSVVVGRIDEAWIENDLLKAWGTTDLNNPDGAEYARQLAGGFSNRVSVDLDDLVATMADHSGNQILAVEDWRLSGATAVGISAFDEAVITPEYSQPTPHLVASVDSPASFRPPKSWFEDPKLEKLTPLVITDDGRVYGHIADWTGCHRGFSDRCILPFRNRTDYSGFHTGYVVTAEDQTLSAGVLTMGGGHADLTLSAREAVRHYDDAGTGAAIVRAGEDGRGIWVAGAVLPGTDIPRLRAMSCSGDWRSGEMVAVLAVPHPGFPIARVASLESEEPPLALVAAGIVPQRQESLEARLAVLERKERARQIAARLNRR